LNTVIEGSSADFGKLIADELRRGHDPGGSHQGGVNPQSDASDFHALQDELIVGRDLI
jgi:hypothetical protein